MKIHSSCKRFSWSPQILIGKRNCVESKYYEDNYIQYFCPKSTQDSLFSTAVTCRVVGIRKVIDQFVKCFKDNKVQFVNLGSGLDTISFWVLQKYNKVVCYDSDLEFQVKLKVDIILKTKELLDLFPNYKSTESTFSSDRYNLFPCDLTKIEEVNKLKDFGFSDQLPTIYLSEFSLAYVPNKYSNKVIKFLSDYSLGPSIFVNYEFVLPTSPFMKWLHKNVIEDNTPPTTIYDFPNKESQVFSLGWEHVFVHDLTFVYNNMIDKNERLRLRKIEDFNDLKSLGIYLNHFVLGVSTKGCNNLKDFYKYLEESETKYFDPDDELLKSYTPEELETETNIDRIIKSMEIWLNITLNVDNDEFKSFFNKFK